MVVDLDYSSANGAWACESNIGPLPATLKIEVAKAKLSRRKIVCHPDAVKVHVSPLKLPRGNPLARDSTPPATPDVRGASAVWVWLWLPLALPFAREVADRVADWRGDHRVEGTKTEYH